MRKKNVRFVCEMNVICHAFDDPPQLTRDIEDESQKLEIYQRVRDRIRQMVENLPGKLNL